jgi:hypothetical protein
MNEFAKNTQENIIFKKKIRSFQEENVSLQTEKIVSTNKIERNGSRKNCQRKRKSRG